MCSTDSENESLAALYVEDRTAGFGAETKRRILLGTFALSSGYYEAYYGRAMRARALLSADFDGAFVDADVIVCPAIPAPAFRLGEKVDDPLAMYMNDLCTIPSNLAGNASASFPVGLAPEDGLPVGLQVIAPPMADDRLYRVGGALERSLTADWGGPLLARIGSEGITPPPGLGASSAPGLVKEGIRP